jgi:hypothetical protein
MKNSVVFGVAAVLLLGTGCSQAPQQESATIRKMPAGQQYSGFLSSYANLKPNPKFENTVSYVSPDPNKNVHKYVEIIVEPPAVYVSTDSDEKLVTNEARQALIDYFQNAITRAVGDAFPIAETKGPLVLRLRSALIGVDVDSKSSGQKGDSALEHPINIGKVGVEMELVDSETGEQIAAVVDRENLGEGAEVGSTAFSKEEKAEAAREAFDGWASRLREYLDSVHEHTDDDVKRIEGTNFPYASRGKK